MPQASIPNHEPSALSAGDSASWVIHHSDYLPDDGCSMSYAFARQDEQHVVNSTDNSDGGHLLSISSAESATWGAGVYTYYGYIIDGAGERVLLRQGKLNVLPDLLAATTGHDGRSQWQRILDGLKAAFEQYAISNGAVSEFSIDDVTRKFNSLEEIAKAIATAESRVQHERDKDLLAQGRPTGRKVYFRMLR